MSKQNTAVAAQETISNLPAYMNQESSRGNENVGSQLAIPQIKQLQKMSHEVDKYNPKFVEGAEPGNFFNVLTGQLYTSDIHVLNLNFSPYFQVKTKYGVSPSKYLGKFRSFEQANALLQDQDETDRADLEITDGHTHLLVLLNTETGTIEGNSPVIFDFAGSKLRVSTNWNAQIAANSGDRFSSVWKLNSVQQEGKMGTFLNLKLSNVGWANEIAYHSAEKMYAQYSQF
ncbi:MAG: hypothetical protein CMJ25_21185 [Phycisphaerae bacterium]|nr:hypothetical protein [Phycisphaerae bacterium]|tara:strand:- start:25 stop:714 length:690 start_codon:yes stop_codon:yes gene_type:complete